MRYKTTEEIAIVGVLTIGTTVSVKLINLLTDTLVVLNNNACTESSHAPGIYVWNTSNISTPISGYTVLLYEMTDGTNTVQGKFVYGGYIDEQTTQLSGLEDKVDAVPTNVWNKVIV